MAILAVTAVIAFTWQDCDFNDDGYVDLLDLTHFSSWYPTSNCVTAYNTTNTTDCQGTDIGEDNDVDIVDLSIFTQYYNCNWNSSNETGCWQ